MGNKSKYAAQITDIYEETDITAIKLLEYFILLVEIVCIPLNSTSLLKPHSK